MKAKFKTKCPECEGDIKPGQEIVKHEGRWIHETCAPKGEFP